MTMKRFLVATLLTLLALPAAAETNIGVVDLRRALFASEGAQSFSEQLQGEFSDEEKKVRAAQQEAQKLKERMEKDGAMMNESERDELSQKFREKVQEFQYMKQRLDQQVANRKQQFLKESRPKVDQAVKELQNEHDLDVILPAEAVVYSKPEMDLTGQLLDKLNK